MNQKDIGELSWGKRSKQIKKKGTYKSNIKALFDCTVSVTDTA